MQGESAGGRIGGGKLLRSRPRPTARASTPTAWSTTISAGLTWARPASSGRFGFALRVLPRHEALVTPFATKLIYWA